jgi:hypothetical protein
MNDNTPFNELATRLERENAALYAKVINRCLSGAYGDFTSDFATPKMQMVTDLREVGLDSIAQDVINGKYDQ